MARTESFTTPFSASRRVAAMRTPATVRGKLEILSMSSPVTPMSFSTCLGMGQMHMVPPRSIFIFSTIQPCIRSFARVLVSKSSMFSSNTLAPAWAQAAAVEKVWAVVLA